MMSGLKILTFLFAISATGCMADIFEKCRKDYKCDEIALHGDIRDDIGRFPNVEKLRDMCPKALSYFRCLSDFSKSCVGLPLEQVAAHENKTIAHHIAGFISIGNLVADMCDENSPFHLRYVANVECIRTKTPEPTCMEEALSLAQVYEELENSLGVDVKTVKKEKECSIVMYALGCYLGKLREECGDAARSVLVDIMRRVEPEGMPALEGCSHDIIRNIKNRPHLMEMEEDKRNHILESPLDSIFFPLNK